MVDRNAAAVAEDDLVVVSRVALPADAARQVVRLGHLQDLNVGRRQVAVCWQEELLIFVLRESNEKGRWQPRKKKNVGEYLVPP